MPVSEQASICNDVEVGAEKVIIDDLDALLDVLPPHIAQSIREQECCSELLEIVMDLGRVPEARFLSREVIIDSREVTEQDLEYVISHISPFTSDNRSGLERTLHRISAIRNRQGRIIGLTCRVGRAVLGTVTLIDDLVQSGKSILLLGRPGVGKTTMLREVARVLADELKKRVVVVDTSNEIAGDGDIPHPAIGHARRMQVPTPAQQHAVMIEAVENHMPEAIVIDEIGTELEAAAARTIAERGVQLVGTAHGTALDNLVINPTLADLVGGIQVVTLGDEEARRRGTQKSVLERKAPPTFDVVVEIQGFSQVIIHSDVGEVVDAILRGQPITTETRWVDESQEVHIETKAKDSAPAIMSKASTCGGWTPQSLYLFGVNRFKMDQVAREMHLPLNLTSDLSEADMVVTSRNYYHRKPQKLRDAEEKGLPVYVLKSSTAPHIRQFFDTTYIDKGKAASMRIAMGEAEQAVDEVINGVEEVELSSQNSYIRRLQHLIAERHDLHSCSVGEGHERRVRIFKDKP